MTVARDIGIDLGTANILVYLKGKGIVIREPSVVAVNRYSGEVLAVGGAAKKMLGRTPASIVSVRPIKEGVIADYDMAEQLLRYTLKKAQSAAGVGRSNIIISVPSGVTEVEFMAVEQAVEKAGAKRHPILFEEPVLAAIGAGIDLKESSGSMVVDIGGGTAEVAVLSAGGVVLCKSLRTAGDALDEAIINYVKRERSLLIGDRTAEDIKCTIGAAYPKPQEEYMEVKGRDLKTGLPKNIKITSTEISEAITEPVNTIVAAIKESLEETPPELSADVMDHGIMLTGGGALLGGLDRRIKIETGIPVTVAEKPMDCVALGAGKCLEDAKLRRLIYKNRNMGV
ncbi:MAG: rod shape-determining protein [Clostridia bacterium]|nr:rod shape-determining protein [Clostridia bacterium]